MVPFSFQWAFAGVFGRVFQRLSEVDLMVYLSWSPRTLETEPDQGRIWCNHVANSGNRTLFIQMFWFLFLFCFMSFVNAERLQLDPALFISAFTSRLCGFSLIFMRTGAKIHRKPWNSSAGDDVLMGRRIKADLVSTGLDINCSYMKRIAFKHAQRLLGLWN